MEPKRPSIRVKFKFNTDTSEIEEFIIDDNAASASEQYHDKVAHAIASRLSRVPEIVDAGPVRLQEAETKLVGEDEEVRPRRR